MRVLHIQTGMSPAGNAAFRLHLAMRKAGIDSFVLTYLPSVKRNNVYSIGNEHKFIPAKIIDKLYIKNIKSYLKPSSYTYNIFSSYSKCNIKKYASDYDVIYLHWICGFISFMDIRKLASLGKPIIFFMHDMWTFTGGCHHSFECSQYKEGCKNCLMFNKHNSIAREQSRKKQELFKALGNLHFVSPSEWMANCAKTSSVLRDKFISVIPNVVDETIFKPIDKLIARKILNLPDNKTIITFGCQAGTKNKYKGWKYLAEAINKIELQNVHILVYGSDYQQQTVDEIKYPITFLGPVFDEYVLSLICNATDVFVSPSLAESFGLTFLENILCGTPVVGFDCTAIPEIVKTGITGYLSVLKDSDDLANGISKMIAYRTKMDARANYSSSEIVNMHLNLINRILHGF